MDFSMNDNHQLTVTKDKAQCEQRLAFSVCYFLFSQMRLSQPNTKLTREKKWIKLKV
jgi:hypothetical protein